ncbi:branched-chain amino acid transport system II carrier protein [Anaerosphaera multitolerans]|uniref:Branched-chain amino acid transport system carrier protein n=1 Tax=Anaerosphaera multitolerans TaxID=2487351 RepID=A0A437S4W3_9FIRM|nr:branched-chain amino acid transport system II carrier protein [Anaerosphaera multitolerans]RVU54006.1 branched-chain amino acid transport system II carrier protein [Anaerosphaera multitolerans]
MKQQGDNYKRWDIIFIGLAFFASYFGAGNLIFPPMLGLESGTGWFPAVLGLTLSGIILPLATIVVISFAGGSVDSITSRVSKNFYKIIVGCIMVFANFVSVPRTAAVAAELGLQGIFPKLPYIPIVIIYFILAFYFVRTKENVIDKIGKILTPALALILFAIVILGLVNPVGTPSEPVVSNTFVHSFLGGYQTGDVLVSFMMANVFIGAITSKGYISDSSRNKAVLKASFIAFICLFIVYGGLLFMGAYGGSRFNPTIERSALLVNLVELLGGRITMVGFGIAVFLACFTTAVAQVTAISDYFVELSADRLNYKLTALVVSVIATSVALLGVDNIVKFSNPLFMAMYPTCIALIILGYGRKLIPNDGGFKGGVILTLLYSIFEAILSTGFSPKFIRYIVEIMPLHSYGFGWVLPFIVGLLGGTLIYFFISPKKAEKL